MPLVESCDAIPCALSSGFLLVFHPHDHAAVATCIELVDEADIDDRVTVDKDTPTRVEALFERVERALITCSRPVLHHEASVSFEKPEWLTNGVSRDRAVQLTMFECRCVI
jgi:hypothetical protein